MLLSLDGHVILKVIWAMHSTGQRSSLILRGVLSDGNRSLCGVNCLKGEPRYEPLGL